MPRENNNLLNRVMEFDHVIEVMPDGTVNDEVHDMHAPESVIETDDDGQTLKDHEDGWRRRIESEGWAVFTDGYSGQYGYRGPIMHASEFIGGQLADDILAQPGFYAAVVVSCLPLEEDGESEDAGWAVVYREHRPSPNGHRDCACCGDYEWHDENQPVCAECVKVGCERTKDAEGEWGWWNCQRTDSTSAREAMAREIQIKRSGPETGPITVSYHTGDENWQHLLSVDLFGQWYVSNAPSYILGLGVARADSWQQIVRDVARGLASDNQTGPLGDALEDWLAQN